MRDLAIILGGFVAILCLAALGACLIASWLKDRRP